MSPKKILVTGVQGLLGHLVCNHLHQFPDHYEVYGLDRSRHRSDRVETTMGLRLPSNRLFHADLSRLNKIKKAFTSMDVVIHLAASTDLDADWNELLTDNIISTYNVFQAAAESGVRGVLYASSATVVLGHALNEPYRSTISGIGKKPLLEKIDVATTLRPIKLYSSTKAWGEILARNFFESQGLRCVCLRLGSINCADKPEEDPFWRGWWCSHSDFISLVEKGLSEMDNLGFEIYYGFSEKSGTWWELPHSERTDPKPNRV